LIPAATTLDSAKQKNLFLLSKLVTSFYLAKTGAKPLAIVFSSVPPGFTGRL
jgi:hypothetical protein